MDANVFLLLNLALSFYLIGAIWAVEVDIFRSWKLVSAKDFRMVQSDHWRKLPYWVFTPLALALAGSPGSIGIGVAGMMQRVKEFGGEFRLQDAKPGTLVEAVIPVSAAVVDQAVSATVM